jgi:hypothetical protein
MIIQETANMTPFQLSALVKGMLGVRPNTWREGHQGQLHEELISVMMTKTANERKGRKEVTTTQNRGQGLQKITDGWTLLGSVTGEGQSLGRTRVDCPTAQAKRERRAHEQLGRPLTPVTVTAVPYPKGV